MRKFSQLLSVLNIWSGLLRAVVNQVVHFSGFSIGKPRSQRVKVVNISRTSQRLHIFGPSTDCFKVFSARCWFSQDGMKDQDLVDYKACLLERDTLLSLAAPKMSSIMVYPAFSPDKVQQEGNDSSRLFGGHHDRLPSPGIPLSLRLRQASHGVRQPAYTRSRLSGAIKGTGLS